MANKPIIGLTAFFNTDGPSIFKVNSSYVNAIIEAGGIPLIIPVTADINIGIRLAEQLDGLLVPGGQDIAPQLFNEEPVPQVSYHQKHEDLFEFALIKEMYSRRKPILGICRGEQVINVAFGGTLYQDIPSQTNATICHVQSSKIRAEGTHSISITEDSKLAEILGTTKIYVNSYHHQSVKEIAKGFKISAVAPDGIIEAIESEDGLIIAVQWHPEEMKRENHFKEMFEKFILSCQ